ncbi:hypothetical protein niasHS_012886 [Heterodera schachtii]|uniref:Uncharacterized protein n=2 Tax=Heterodera TaxID=34509 RepID=A0ABD2J5L8_HETSC
MNFFLIPYHFIHFRPQYQQQEFQFQTFVNSRGWQGIRDSMYFMKAGVEAIIEDEVTSRFKAKRAKNIFFSLFYPKQIFADNDEKEYNHSQQDHHNHSSPAFGAHDATIIINVDASSANANENKENDGDRDGTNNTEQRRQRSK